MKATKLILLDGFHFLLFIKEFLHFRTIWEYLFSFIRMKIYWLDPLSLF